MSDTSQAIQPNNFFMSLHNKSYRLAAAVFTISNIIDQDEELRTKIRNLSLELVSMTVSLKDTNFSDARKIVSEIERKALELMSMLDIASIAGLISRMNGDILKEEFQLFINELKKYSQNFEESRSMSVNNIFSEQNLISGSVLSTLTMPHALDERKISNTNNPTNTVPKKEETNGNNNKRKDQRKNNILEFIKGHDNVSIKDIVPHVVGCSEKTVQRELINLVNEGKIKKTGERRWSRYSVL